MPGDWIKKVDFLLIFSTLGLIVYGIIALYSSSQPAFVSGRGTNYFLLQIIWVGMGVTVAAIVFFLPNKWIYQSAYWFYGFSILALLLVLFFGKTGLGATRWLKLGFLRFQPSELAKFASLLALARFLSNKYVDVNRIRDFAIAMLIVFLPFVLVLRQPDLGTSLVFLVMILPVLYWAGLKPGNLFLIVMPVVVLLSSFNFYTFLAAMLILTLFLFWKRRNILLKVLAFVGNVSIGIVTPIIWQHLKPYQQQRIKIFWKPEADPLGAGYQIIQSKVAIGSGGLFGKGFLHGSQTQLRFLPEQHTDFIFAVIGEEFGFVGVMIGILLFAVFLMRCVKIASLTKNPFNSIVGIGVSTIVGFQMAVNIGMTVGLLPVTGLPLPFISYGGSAMLINLLMVGVLLNIYRNRFKY